MDLKAKHSAPVLTDSVPVNESVLGIRSSLYLTIPRKKPISGLLDDVLANGWLDAMKSSSPPRKKLSKDFNFEAALNEREAAYRSWLVKCPSAISSFEQIINCAKGKQIALFLDYDGTLSPIVDDPERAFMSSSMRAAVRTAAKYFPTAIISGRCRDKVYEFVGLTELYYAGSHGMDIMCPVTHSASAGERPNCIRSIDKQGKELKLFQPASEFLPMIDEVFRSLVENTNGIEGAKVENNKFCVSVHYRLVDEKFWKPIAQCVHDVLKSYPRLRLIHGRKVMWSLILLIYGTNDAGLSNCEDVLPIYVGDDRTDEDAFEVLRERNCGYGILVSSIPKESKAFYSLRDPSENSNARNWDLTLLETRNYDAENL
ncbi:hypothetical protein ACLOJK_033412 [Asimina triloba]